MENQHSKLSNIVWLLLLIHFFLAVTSMAQKSVTSDELIHISAGYSYLTENDFRYNPEHPPLVKEIAAIPLLFMNLNLDKGEAWLNSYEWIAGRDFFFKDNDNADLILFLSRLSMVLISLLLLFFIYLVASDFYGKKAGIFAMFLYAFSPTVLAHARIVHTDIASALIILAGIYFFRKLLNNPGMGNAVLNGIVLGLALSIKFTTLFLFAFYIILFLIFIFNKKHQLQKKNKIYDIFTANKFKNFIKYTLIILIIPLIILFIFYGFHFDLYNNDLKEDIVVNVLGNNFIGKTVYGLVSVVPVPSQYLQGLKQVTKQSQTGYRAYLMGKYQKGGWLSYFPIAFLIKTPLATILLLIFSLIFWKLRKNWMDELFLLIPMVLYFIFFVTSELNIGIRHILPVYIFLFIFVSKLINHKRFLMKVLLFVLGIWYVIASVSIYPHYIAYFNEVVTPDYGHNFLLDSNLDWGQDLKGLAKYLKDNNIDDEIILSYWGNDDPDYRDMNYVFYRRILDENGVCQPVEGYIAVSANLRVGMKDYEANCFNWLDEYEPITKIGYSIWLYKI